MLTLTLIACFVGTPLMFGIFYFLFWQYFIKKDHSHMQRRVKDIESVTAQEYLKKDDEAATVLGLRRESIRHVLCIKANHDDL